MSDQDLRDIERDLWGAADKLRGSLHPGEYQHVVLSLVLLRYLGLEGASCGFKVPESAGWDLIANPDQGSTAAAVGDAVDSLELANPQLKGLLSREWTDGRIDDRRLRDVVNLLGALSFRSPGGDDLLGTVYEYFLGRFAESDKKGGGEFYTPRCVVELLVELLEPLSGLIYDPCCGTGGMFVRTFSFVQAHGKSEAGVSVVGQESNATTWKLAKMNLLLRGISFDLGERPADTLHHDLHPDLEADYVLANPPFNMSAWGASDLRDDPRWAFGDPPEGSANFAWIQHILHHLAPGGRAGIVLANGSLSGSKGPEAEIRQRLVESGAVECMIALPSKLFYSTQIAASVWVVSRRPLEDAADNILFVDASRFGHLETRSQRTLSAEDRSQIAEAFHRWRADPNGFDSKAGFAAAVDREKLAHSGYVLSPPRYVGLGAEESHQQEDIQMLKTEIRDLIETGKELDAAVLEAIADVEA